MTNDIFRDDWLATGKDFFSLKSICQQLTHMCRTEVISKRNIAFLSVKGTLEKIGVIDLSSEDIKELLVDAPNAKCLQDLRILYPHLKVSETGEVYEEIAAETDDSISVDFLENNSFKRDPSTGLLYLPITTVKKEDTREFEEAYGKDKLSAYDLLLYVNKKLYFTNREIFVNSCKQTFQLSGKYLNENPLFRNLMFANAMPDGDYTIIFLEDGKYRKLLAIRGEDFRAETCMDLYRETNNIINDSFPIVGKIDLVNYEFNHKTRNIFLACTGLCKKMGESIPAGLTPGLLIRSSGTGFSPFEIHGIWFYNQTWFYQGSSIRKFHYKNFKLEPLSQEVGKIFTEQQEFARKLPEHFDADDSFWDNFETSLKKSSNAEILGKRRIDKFIKIFREKTFSGTEGLLTIIKKAIEFADTPTSKESWRESVADALINALK